MNPPKPTDVLHKHEIEELTRTSDLRGAWAVISTWGSIAATFGVLAWLPHPVTFIAAVVVLGGRQLALAILMHEAAHRTLFRSRWLNDVAADWLCARPIWTDVARYRMHHIRHHKHTGTPEDPDRSLSEPFPIGKASLARKLVRDVVLVSGIKRLYGLLLIDAELLSYTVASDPKRLPWRGFGHHAKALLRHGLGFAVESAILVGALAAMGHAWVAIAWFTAFVTTYGLFLRIRSMAEHACTAPPHATRTTRANLLARMTVAPLSVNYHLEHHLLMRVPYFRLRAMHELLAKRRALPASSLSNGYLDVLRTVTTANHP